MFFSWAHSHLPRGASSLEKAKRPARTGLHQAVEEGELVLPCTRHFHSQKQ